ncbi:MAG: AMP-binding protein, partial [Bacteroidota bacterium]
YPLLAQVLATMQDDPTRVALVDKAGLPHTYQQLHTYIVGAQQKLQSLGVTKGHRVLLAVPMSVELYALLLSTLSLGAIAIFLDPWMKGRQMNRVLQQVHPDILIIQKRLKKLAYILPAAWKIRY